MDINEWRKRKYDLEQRCKYGQWGSCVAEYDDARGFFLQKTAYDALDSVFLARVVNMASSFFKKPWSEMRVLDLACMDGLSSIEFAMQGAKEVVGIEGRAHQVECANFTKESLGLTNLTFYQDDVKNVTKEKYGSFDVVLCLGILYHLDVPFVFNFAKNIGEMVTDFAIIDTHFVFDPETETEFDGKRYQGSHVFEHKSTTPVKERQLYGFEASLDDERSFWLTKPSICNLLIHSGFSSLYECIYPRGGKRQVNADRLTLIAQKGSLRPLKSVDDVGAQSLDRLPESDGTMMVSVYNPMIDKRGSSLN